MSLQKAMGTFDIKINLFMHYDMAGNDKEGRVSCALLNENGFDRLICLNTLPPLDGISGEGLRSLILLEEVCLW